MDGLTPHHGKSSSMDELKTQIETKISIIHGN